MVLDGSFFAFLVHDLSSAFAVHTAKKALDERMPPYGKFGLFRIQDLNMKVISTILALFLCAVFLTRPSPAAAANMSTLENAIAFLKAETSKLGVARLDGDTLYFGIKKINGNFTIVDRVKLQHGITATIFAKEGDGFVRITTNVVNQDGYRAVGTKLDPSGPAIAAIRQGQRYAGETTILGSKFNTIYEPIIDYNGKLAGVLYVGYQM